jgi:hypothetical protein
VPDALCDACLGRVEHKQALASATGGPSAEEVQQLQQAHSAELNQVKLEFSGQIEGLKLTHAAEINALRAAHRAELTALRARHESELAAQSVERGEAGTQTEGDEQAQQQQRRGVGMDAEIPSPLQRRFQQRLHQVSWCARMSVLGRLALVPYSSTRYLQGEH